MVTQVNNPAAHIRPGGWVLLLHRLPREPSAPRIALWRAVRRLGAVLLGDGLVALPASERTIEHFEWLAAGIEEQGGAASTWIASPRNRRLGQQLVAAGRDAVDAEYRAVMLEVERIDAGTTPGDRQRSIRRLRGLLRRIDSRNYFDAPSAGLAREAVERLARISRSAGSFEPAPPVANTRRGRRGGRVASPR